MSRRRGAAAAVQHGVWTGVGTAIGGLLVLLVLLWLFGDDEDEAGGGVGTLDASSSGSTAGCGWL